LDLSATGLSMINHAINPSLENYNKAKSQIEGGFLGFGMGIGIGKAAQKNW
jgi:hypothetical protein